MTSSRNSSPSARFQPGDRVRVQRGVIDPDFSDIPLGGWAGMISEVEKEKGETTYLIEWNRATLAGMHPVYVNRCERDGLEPKSMWLGEADLEEDDGTPVPMEQPTEIKTPALSEKDQEDRVRAVFGLTHDDPLPEVSEETLLAYHLHLIAHLKFPLHVTSWEKAGPFVSKKVTIAISGLANPGAGGIDEEFGLLCVVRDPSGEVIEFPLDEIEVKRKDPNRRLISDYAFWLHNWR